MQGLFPDTIQRHCAHGGLKLGIAIDSGCIADIRHWPLGASIRLALKLTLSGIPLGGSQGEVPERAYMARIYFNTCTLLSRYIAVHLAGSLFEFIFADILRREGNVFARLSSSLS